MTALRRRALLIGNARFPQSQDVPQGAQRLVELKGPPNDVKGMAAALTHAQAGLHRAEDVRTIIDGTKDEVLREIDAFFGAARFDDQLLLYYSGHGVRDASRLWLCAHDTRTTHLVSTGIADAVVSAAFDRSSCPRIAFILDCCYSGAFKDAGEIPASLSGSGRFILTAGGSLELASDADQAQGMSAFHALHRRGPFVRRGRRRPRRLRVDQRDLHVRLQRA